MKILIVDDEFYFREALKKTIPWRELGVEVCGEADNGIEALNKAKSLKPDIILVDINMPKMNGLEFIKNIRKFDSNVEIIIVSGYDEFDYAQRAIALGVQDYILKPLNEKELCDILLSIKTKIGKKRIDIKYRKDLESKLKKSKEMEKKHTIKRLLLPNATLENNELVDKLKKNGWSLINVQKYSVIVGEVDNNLSLKKLDLWNFVVINMLEELFLDNIKYEVCIDDDRRIILITEMLTNKKHIFLQESIEKVQEKIRAHFDFTISFGIGDFCNSISGIYNSYLNAIRVLECKLSTETSIIMSYDNVLKNQFDNFIIPTQTKLQLVLLLREQNITEITKIIQTLFEQMKPLRIAPDTLRVIVIDLLMPCLQLVKEKQILFEEGTNKGYLHIFDHVKNKKTLGEFENYVKKIYHLTCKYKVEGSETKIPDTIQRVLDFIEDNFEDSELSINIIAKEVFINYNYLCVIFKKSMGITINEYILKYRMQKAVDLINSGIEQVGEVAQMVGYADPNYFTKCFKRELGVPPSRYISCLGQ